MAASKTSKFQGLKGLSIPKYSKGQKPQQAVQTVGELPKIGRPRTGKRSNPAFKQVSAWVRKDTYAEVDKRLFLDGKKEFSDLVQSLLEKWLKDGK